MLTVPTAVSQRVLLVRWSSVRWTTIGLLLLEICCSSVLLSWHLLLFLLDFYILSHQTFCPNSLMIYLFILNCYQLISTQQSRFCIVSLFLLCHLAFLSSLGNFFFTGNSSRYCSSVASVSKTGLSVISKFAVLTCIEGSSIPQLFLVRTEKA